MQIKARIKVIAVVKANGIILEMKGLTQKEVINFNYGNERFQISNK